MSLAWILRYWLAQQAQATLRDKVSQAVEEQLARDPAGTTGEQAGVDRCDIGIVFALGAESGGTEDLLAEKLSLKGEGFVAHTGLLAGRNVAIVVAGAGRLAAARGTQALVRGHRPEWIISAGFAGGLVPQLRQGDIVMGNEVLDISGRRLALDLKAEPSARLHVGRLLTVDHIIREPADKAALGKEHAALAVDMESWAVGEVCRQDKVRFLAIRVISDAVDDRLPEDLDKLVMQQSTAGRLGAAAGTIFRRPASIKDMLRLRETALVSSDRLAKFLAQIVTQLVPEKAPG